MANNTPIVDNFDLVILSPFEGGFWTAHKDFSTTNVNGETWAVDAGSTYDADDLGEFRAGGSVAPGPWVGDGPTLATAARQPARVARCSVLRTPS